MSTTTIPIPDQPDTSIVVARDDDPVPAVIVRNDEWGHELHVPVAVARQVAAAIMAGIPA